MTLEGIKIIYILLKKPNKIWYKVSRDYIKFPTFTKYQNNKKESSSESNKCSKQQKTESINKNSSGLANFLPPLNMSGIFADFCAYRG
jgi:hypothetical protein